MYSMGRFALSTYVLVHGSWHTGEAWSHTAKHLEAKGHKVFTPTIAGHGKGVDKKVNHADCTKSIVDAIVGAGLSDIVLLGHSFAGTIISKAAEAIPERIRRLVYLNAFVLRDGTSLNDEVPPPFVAMFDQLAKASPDNTVMLPFPIWRDAFINDADLATATSAYDQLSPEPYQPFCDKLDMKKLYSLEIPKSYLNCTEDTALPHGEQWGWHPRLSSRLGLFRLVQMPGSHEPMYSNPALLAEKIVEAGRD